MLVSLGSQSRTGELVDLLAACHARIRQHLILARRLVVQGPERSEAEIRETAAQIRRYFMLGLPLHIADEDLTIAPRLRAAGLALPDRIALDHASHQPLIAALVALCGEVEREPSRLKIINARLAPTVALLAIELAAHLELEERTMFTALAALSSRERDEIAAALRARREGTLHGS